MQAPAFPTDEALRLQTLIACAILDTPTEERFDRLTRLARRLFQTPIALISLIDSERQWFKSRQGLDATETARDISFCGHAILSPDVLYIPDASLDTRFADNPLVANAPHIRFYAGAPLRASNGQHLGTLCIIDTQARTLAAADLATLRDLADCVEREFSREEQQRQHHALLALTAITSLSYQDPDSALQQSMSMACDYLGMTCGQISRLQNNRKEILLYQSGNSLHATQEQAGQATLCHLPETATGLIQIANLADSEYRHCHHLQTDVQSLIGLRLHIHAKDDAALCIWHTEARVFPFSEVETDFVRLLADWISGVMKRQELDRQLQRQRALSDAIAMAQALFIRETGQEKGFVSLLAAILKLTESAYGFICEVKNKNASAQALKSMMLAWNTATDHISSLNLEAEARDAACQQLKSRYGHAFKAALPVIDNDLTTEALNQVFPAHLETLHSFLCIPVQYDGELIALVGIANKADGYDQQICDFLSPLFSTLGQLISAARVQKQRRETERQLANVIKGTNIGTWECNILTGETIYNERWAEMLGYTLAELEPTTVDTWLKLCHPEDLQITSGMIEQHFRGEIEYFDLKSRMRHKDGHWIWIHDRGCVVSWGPNGEPLIMSGSHADITRQKEAEAELEHTYELLEKSNAAARIGTWGLEIKSRKLQWSKVTKEIHEVDDDFSCGVDEAVAFYKGVENQQRIRELFVRAVREGMSFDTEFCILSAKGNERWVHVIGFPQFEDNVCVRVYGTFQDISERRATAENLRDQAAHTSAILDNVLDGIITFDEDNHILSVNNAAIHIFDFTADELLGKSILQLIPYSSYSAPDNITPGIQDIIGISREVEARRKDGELFPLDLSVSTVRRQGKPLYIALMRDITERKRTEKIKNEFISTVSHELRTPLTSISGALGLISGGVFGSYSERMKQMIDVANKNCQRLTFLINDLLDMEKLTAGKMVFRLEASDLSDLLQQAVEANQTFGTLRGVSLRLSKNIPAISISVDTQRFMQVLSNLLSNAIKYSPENDAVEIEAEQRGKKIRICVIDHGVGIPHEFRERIFQKFAQADSSDTRQNGGTGLGLAITRELVERMGGSIGFESTPGLATRFHVDLPVSSGDLILHAARPGSTL
ncbi:PAS domain S-box protein [Undibacterium sp. JH2W]|uniref:PAS domain S-box protein n=1 Tax=Undibacterium sp. JH2W TaxID=3413037 RepID=UPI003BF3A6B5